VSIRSPVASHGPSMIDVAPTASFIDGHRVIRLCGELDIFTRDVVRRTCLEGNDVAIVVDMTDLTFIDCAGYGSLITVRNILTDLGGSLTIRNQTGQPAFLLSVLWDLEAAEPHQHTREALDK
jgi:anti-anti-sigma factor